MKRQLLIVVGLLIVFSLFPRTESVANNVRINTDVTVDITNSNQITLKFGLQWDNSWRDEFNWDAVWLFVKYKKKDAVGAWRHLMLAPVTPVASGLDVDYGRTGKNSIVGAFVYRHDAGSTALGEKEITLYAPIPSEVTAKEVLENCYFSVSAVEMVLIPFNSFYAGDTTCYRSFITADKQPVLVGCEDAVTVYEKGSTVPVSIPATYPKGYKGFYSMKYEVSQEQYVNFLNMLSYTQQTKRVGIPLAEENVGKFVFGGQKTKPSCRNGIVLATYNGTTKPAVFANNLNGNDVYFEEADGMTLVCNYLSVNDMLAYMDWSGLRPLSEMEYEKASRASDCLVAGEYAWNLANGLKTLSGLSGLSKAGTEQETPVDYTVNANAGGKVGGPVRCGAFANSSTNQVQAGAGYYGVMEMSGNIAEIYYKALSGSGFNTSDTTNVAHGDGTLATGSNVSGAYWPDGIDNFIVRGGSFASPDSALRVSDRGKILSSADLRDSTVGFRGGRSLNGGIRSTGKIVSENGLTVDTVCPVSLGLAEGTLNISGDEITSPDGLPIRYVWVVNGKAIKGQISKDLIKHTDFENTTESNAVYVFTRKAMTVLGEWESNKVTINVPNPRYTLNMDSVTMSACKKIETTLKMTSGAIASYKWIYDGTPVGTGSTYLPTYDKITNPSGVETLTCEVTVNQCKTKQNLTLFANSCSSVTYGSLADGSDRETYPAEAFSCLCFMTKNLNVGTYVTGVSTQYTVEGIQKFCPNGTSDNCKIYGGMYEWWEAVCGGKCKPAPSYNTNVDGYTMVNYGAKTVKVGKETFIQGICPDGWHLPAYNDFITLQAVSGWFNKWNGQYAGYNSSYNYTTSGSWFNSYYCGLIAYPNTTKEGSLTTTFYMYGSGGGSWNTNTMDRRYQTSVRCVRD